MTATPPLLVATSVVVVLTSMSSACLGLTMPPPSSSSLRRAAARRPPPSSPIGRDDDDASSFSSSSGGGGRWSLAAAAASSSSSYASSSRPPPPPPPPREPPPRTTTDDAGTLPEMMSSLWRLVSLASATMRRGESATVIYPRMSHKLADRTFLSKLIAHLDACKDVCDNFGVDTVLVPYCAEGGDDDDDDGDDDSGGDGDGNGNGNDLRRRRRRHHHRGFTVKSYRNPAGTAGTYQQGGAGMIFAPDPFWDDDEVWDFGGIDDDDDDDDARATKTSTSTSTSTTSVVTPSHLVLPDDDSAIVSVTENWVSRMMADLALCPFTQSSTRSGIPPGPVRYAVDRYALTPEDAYASYWSEVSRVHTSGEDEISTTLHVLPKFCAGGGGEGSGSGSGGGVESFEQWADTLTGALGDGQSGLDGLGDMIQLIFFHPDWTFRDGGRDRLGEGGMAGNYARRSPWPMVNILRTRQVRVAQRGIPTGLVYQQTGEEEEVEEEGGEMKNGSGGGEREGGGGAGAILLCDSLFGFVHWVVEAWGGNEKTLSRIGTDALERMLRLRDWSDVEGMKVDRRDMEALRVANDLQVEGVVRAEDSSFAFDPTPAANRVDRGQIDGGDMVNVILQALEIRLGRGKDDGRGRRGSSLNGAQTSAAMMASDFLLEELERIADEYPNDERAPVLDDVRDSDRSRSGSRSGGYAAAYGFDPDDDDEEEVGALSFRSGRELEDAEMSALFGMGGIPMKSDDY
ncbi:hypothetical protein ACHAW5_006088 [Stephanodiscus triporus]|uniref:Uncharacterized protein n=1 Tax=Stephanodiscus triporus TaxID=2934178 RepID=A0ABD3MN14_9STRA